jgi:hypothetical protein
MEGDRIDEFREALRASMADVGALLDAEQVPSDARFEFGKRLSAECRRLGSATYCLSESAEPDDARADVDTVLGRRNEDFAALDDATPLRRKLKRKAGRYGALELPNIVALLCAGDFADDKDIADALLGTTAIQYNPSTLATRTGAHAQHRNGRSHQHQRGRPSSG